MFREKRTYVKTSKRRTQSQVIDSIVRAGESPSDIIAWFESGPINKSSWLHKWDLVSQAQKYEVASKKWRAHRRDIERHAIPEYTIANPTPYNIDGDIFAYAIMTQEGPEFATQYKLWREVEDKLDYSILRSNQDVEDAVLSVFKDGRELLMRYLREHTFSCLEQKYLMALLCFMLRTTQNLTILDIRRLYDMGYLEYNRITYVFNSRQAMNKKLTTKMRQALNVLITQAAERITLSLNGHS